MVFSDNFYFSVNLYFCHTDADKWKFLLTKSKKPEVFSGYEMINSS